MKSRWTQLIRWLLLPCLLATGIAQAGTYTVNGKTIVTLVPSGYCELGAHAEDRAFLKYAEDRARPSNQVVAVYADCLQLEQFRQGTRSLMDSYGLVAAATPGGRFAQFDGRTEEIRARLIEHEVARATIKPATARAEGLRKAQAFNSGGGGTEKLGVVASDDSAYYFATIASQAGNDGKPGAVVGVAGGTFVRGVPISVSHYRRFNDKPDLASVISFQERYMADFVAANKD